MVIADGDNFDDYSLFVFLRSLWLESISFEPSFIAGSNALCDDRLGSRFE